MKKHFCETCSGRRIRRFNSTQKRIKQSYRDHQLMFQGFLVLFVPGADLLWATAATVKTDLCPGKERSLKPRGPQ
jgi:hypothetical protein